MRNKHPILLAGITLFTRQSTAQDTRAPENVKEEKGNPPKGAQIPRPIKEYVTGYMTSSVSANKKLFFFYMDSQNQKVSLKNKVINMINYNTVII
ncbi:hypothetical protein AALM74_04230 [Parabacteroides segnis]|uniref:hypothetical protein n=1 Tax=Parabacteroides segnis TaxID=2763058 RepID=UPI00351237E7